MYGREDRFNSNNRPYFEQHIREAETQLDILRGLNKEVGGWFDRIDKCIDQIADLLDVGEIPYGVDTDYCIKNDIGYNSAYRLEILAGRIRDVHLDPSR